MPNRHSMVRLERCGCCLRSPRARTLVLSWVVRLVGAEKRANAVGVGDHLQFEGSKARD